MSQVICVLDPMNELSTRGTSFFLHARLATEFVSFQLSEPGACLLDCNDVAPQRATPEKRAYPPSKSVQLPIEITHDDV